MSIELADLSANTDVVQVNGINYCGLSNIHPEIATHYLVYRIINTFNGRYYIGQHKTQNPLDNYMGSGKYIERAINKYPVSSFIKEILFDFDNFEQMNEKEKELIPISACYPYNPMSYNLIEGGSGQLTDAVKQRISKSLKSGGKVAGKNNPMYGYKWSDEQKKHQSEIMTGRRIPEKVREACRKRYAGTGNPMYGKHHTEQSRQKMSDVRKQLRISAGENNPMHGLKCLNEHQKEEWKRKISVANTGRKMSQEEKLRRSINAKARHIRRLHNPITGKIVNIPEKDIQRFLDEGYVYGTGLRTRFGKIGACAGKRIMTSPDGSKHYIKIEDIPKYMKLGWKLSKRSKPIS